MLTGSRLCLMAPIFVPFTTLVLAKDDLNLLKKECRKSGWETYMK